MSEGGIVTCCDGDGLSIAEGSYDGGSEGSVGVSVGDTESRSLAPSPCDSVGLPLSGSVSASWNSRTETKLKPAKSTGIWASLRRMPASQCETSCTALLPPSTDCPAMMTLIVARALLSGSDETKTPTSGTSNNLEMASRLTLS